MKNKEKPGDNTIISTKAYKIRKDEHGIIWRQVIENSHIDIKEFKEGEDVSIDLNGGGKMLCLIDASCFHTLTPEVLKFMIMAHKETHIATAVVSKNLSQKLYVDYFKREENTHPLKVFPSPDEAVKWLLTYKN